MKLFREKGLKKIKYEKDRAETDNADSNLVVLPLRYCGL